MKRILQLLILAAPLFLSQSGLAEDLDSDTQRYEVEALVFKNLRPISDNNEYLVPETASNDSGPDIENSVLVRRLPKSTSELSNAAEKIAESGDYQIISHRRWVQNADTKTESQRFRIRSSANTFPSLDGTVTFFVSRFLHLDIDLQLNDEVTSFLSSETSIQSYRINETRRIKTTDLNYFDHPQFGVLIKILPIRVSTR